MATTSRSSRSARGSTGPRSASVRGTCRSASGSGVKSRRSTIGMPIQSASTSASCGAASAPLATSISPIKRCGSPRASASACCCSAWVSAADVTRPASTSAWPRCCARRAGGRSSAAHNSPTLRGAGGRAGAACPSQRSSGSDRGGRCQASQRPSDSCTSSHSPPWAAECVAVQVAASVCKAGRSTAKRRPGPVAACPGSANRSTRTWARGTLRRPADVSTCSAAPSIGAGCSSPCSSVPSSRCNSQRPPTSTSRRGSGRVGCRRGCPWGRGGGRCRRRQPWYPVGMRAAASHVGHSQCSRSARY
jgi:hypothetical protein